MTRNRAMFAAAVAFIGVIGLTLWLRNGEFWAIDACLDSGGAWDYAAKECRR